MNSPFFTIKLLWKKFNVEVTLKSTVLTVLKLNLPVAHSSYQDGHICSVGENPGIKLLPSTFSDGFPFFSVISNKDATLTCFFKEVELCKHNCEHSYEHIIADKQYKIRSHGFIFGIHSCKENIIRCLSSSVLYQERQMPLFCFPGLSYWAAWTQTSAHRGVWVDGCLLRSADRLSDFTGKTTAAMYFYSCLF